MNRPAPLSTLQKTYDDTHLVCSTAVYFESRSNEGEALRCWKNALDQLAYHRAYRLPTGWKPTNDTEKELSGALTGLERQARERIGLLEALEESRKEAGISNNSGGLGDTVKPLMMNDLPVPPQLPNRPMPNRQPSEQRDLPIPIITRGVSRSPSPEKKSRLKSTLRPGGKTRTSSSTTGTKATRPPAASKAATLAWSPKDSRTLPPAEPTRTSLDGYVHPKLRAARVRSITPPSSRASNTAVVNEPRAHNTDFDKQGTNSSRKKPISPRSPRDIKSPHLSRSKPRHSEPSRRDDKMPASSPARPNMKMNRAPASTSSPGLSKSAAATASTFAAHRENTNSMPNVMAPVVKRRPLHPHPLPAPPVDSDEPDPFDDFDQDNDLQSHDESETESTESEEEPEPPSWLETTTRILDNLPRGVDHHSAEQILNEVVIQGDEVHWEDIAGLDVAKAALKENVVYPFLRPDLFKGLREPARGILLFGPPGTGKTMLARAVATESKSTFFAVSASSLISKFLGESEKLVRALFSLAKLMAPSVIFVDEIDSLLSSRSDQGEHETSRRIKTEFLIQWSDLARAAAGRDAKLGDPGRVLVLAATNAPWAIDDAARRRFVRRQYIPLPEGHVRATQIRTLLSEQIHSLSDVDVEKLIERTQGL